MSSHNRNDGEISMDDNISPEEDVEDFITNIILHGSVQDFNMNLNGVIADLISSGEPGYTIPYKKLLEDDNSRYFAIPLQNYNIATSMAIETATSQYNSNITVNNSYSMYNDQCNCFKIVHGGGFEKECNEKQIFTLANASGGVNNDFNKSFGILSETQLDCDINYTINAAFNNTDLSKKFNSSNGECVPMFLNSQQIKSSDVKDLNGHNNPVQNPLERIANIESNNFFEITNNTELNLFNCTSEHNDETINLTSFEIANNSQIFINQQSNESSVTNCVLNNKASSKILAAKIRNGENYCTLMAQQNLQEYHIAFQPNSTLIDLKEVELPNVSFEQQYNTNTTVEMSLQKWENSYSIASNQTLRSSKKRHVCSSCSNEYNSKSCLKVDCFNMHTEIKYKCTKCNKKSYLTACTLMKHTQACLMYKCFICYFTTPDISLLKQHLSSYFRFDEPQAPSSSHLSIEDGDIQFGDDLYNLSGMIE